MSILPEPDILSLSPASLNFSTQLLRSSSAAQTETLSNRRKQCRRVQTERQHVRGEPCAGSEFNVTFTPNQSGPRSASIAITDDTAGSPQSVSLDGIGVTSGPNATLSAMSLNFGSQVVNTTSPAQSVTVSNYGNAALNIAGIIASADFAETDNCGTSLASAASCTINLTFTPSATGAINGTLSLSDNASGSPQNVALNGTGA